MSTWDVVVVGGANVDYLVRGPRLPVPGETVQGTEFQHAPGGKGANQAVAAARLGARVAFVGCVGADASGELVFAALTRERVDTRHLRREAGAQTGVAVIQVDTHGEKQIVGAPGANARVTVEDVHAAAADLRAARVLLMQLEVPMEVVRAAARLARAAGITVILDPAPPRDVPDEVLADVDVIRPDRGEARALTGIDPRDRASARQAADALRARGPRIAIVQAGDEGDLAVWVDGECWLPRIPVTAIDATGAGDAFCGALAVILAEGHDVRAAAPFASAAAALATTKLGAQASLPTREEVAALLRTHERHAR